MTVLAKWPKCIPLVNLPSRVFLLPLSCTSAPLCVTRPLEPLQYLWALLLVGCPATAPSQSLSIHYKTRDTAAVPAKVTVCLPGQLLPTISCIGSAAGWLSFKTDHEKKTQAQAINTRQPLKIQLENNNVSLTLTDIFVALVVCWTTGGREISGTCGQALVLGCPQMTYCLLGWVFYVISKVMPHGQSKQKIKCHLVL